MVVLLSWFVLSYFTASVTFSVYDVRLVFLPLIIAIVPVVKSVVTTDRGIKLLRFQEILYVGLGIVVSWGLAFSGMNLSRNGPDLVRWLDERGIEGPVASDSPWKIYYLTGRPAVILPPMEPGPIFKKFLQDYEISALLVEKEDEKRKDGKKLKGAVLIASDANALLDALAKEKVGLIEEKDGWRLWIPPSTIGRSP